MSARDQVSVWQVITDLGRPRAYGPGELLFVEGDRSSSVYACISGRIRIFLTTPSGRELLLGIKQSGDEFGELSAIDGRPRSATARAIDRSVVAVLAADRFVEELHRVPLLSVAVCQNLSAELRRANDRLVTRNCDSARIRTGRMLVELASLRMRHGGDVTHYELPITQSDLAGWIGATRESVARALAEFRREGLVSTSRGCIVVHEVQALHAAVSG